MRLGMIEKVRDVAFRETQMRLGDRIRRMAGMQAVAEPNEFRHRRGARLGGSVAGRQIHDLVQHDALRHALQRREVGGRLRPRLPRSARAALAA